MDALIDFEIVGEVFIPIETEKDKQHQIVLSDLIQLNYANFRKVLFQGELVKMYIVLRSDKKSIVNLNELFESFYIKIEFESFGPSDHNAEEDYDKTLTDLFSINSSKINSNNYNYDPISKKIHYDSDNTAIFEVFKHIIVPQNLLDVDLLMKVDIMTKNENKFAQNIKPLDYYKNGYFKTIQNYRKVKTLFKETKIVRPLKIKDIKQTDVLLDTSLLQAKIENTTSGINFVDEALKTSRFLIKETNTESSSEFRIGMSININEIEILKDETTFDELSTQHVKHIKDLYMKNDKVSLSNISFSIFNKDLPIVLSAGEELNLTIKIVKSAFLSEKSEKDSSNNNQNTASEKESVLLQQDSTSQKGNVLLTAPNVSSSSPFSQYQSKDTPIAMGQSKEFAIANQKPSILTTQGKNEDESVSKVDSYSENYKICFITPFILNLSSSLFFESLFLCVPMKWSNEINRFLKVEINIPEDIILHEYFEIGLKCLNISANEMNLSIEINDTFDDIKSNHNDTMEFKAKALETIPSIISQTKIQHFGLFNCNEDKVFMLKFLPLKNGFNQLPNFSIIDSLSGKRFFIVPANKIFVKENSKCIINRITN